jgi:hypothetical protein
LWWWQEYLELAVKGAGKAAAVDDGLNLEAVFDDDQIDEVGTGADAVARRRAAVSAMCARVKVVEERVDPNMRVLLRLAASRPLTFKQLPWFCCDKDDASPQMSAMRRYALVYLASPLVGVTGDEDVHSEGDWSRAGGVPAAAVASGADSEAAAAEAGHHHAAAAAAAAGAAAAHGEGSGASAAAHGDGAAVEKLHAVVEEWVAMWTTSGRIPGELCMFLIAEDIVEGMAVTPAQAESLWVLTLLNKRFCDGAFACPLLRGVLGSDAQVMAAHVQGTGAYFSRSLAALCAGPGGAIAAHAFSHVDSGSSPDRDT